MNTKSLPTVLCLFLLSFLGCAREEKYQGTPHGIEGQRILREMREWARDQLSLFCWGSGGGMMYEVEELSLFLGHADTSDIPTARCLMVTVVEEFLRRVNEDEKIRPYLSHHPFTEDNLWIVLGFFGEDGDLQETPSLEAVTLSKSSFIYTELAPSESTNLITQFKKVHKETFSEAQRIVREQGCLLPAAGE